MSLQGFRRYLTRPYDENPDTNRKFNNRLTTQRRHQNSDYTMIADRLRTVSWSNNNHPTGVVKPGLKGTNLPTHRNSCVINCTWHERNIVYNTTDFIESQIAVHTEMSNRYIKLAKEVTIINRKVRMHM